MRILLIFTALCALIALSGATRSWTKKWYWKRSTYSPPAPTQPPSCPANCKGDQGPQGLAGPSGPAGPRGGAGNPGVPGRDGAPGNAGLDGFPGDKGAQGVRGRSGAPGTHGAPGLKGGPGLRGHDGLPGAKGSNGVRGPPGNCTGHCPIIPIHKIFIGFSASEKEVKQKDDYYTLRPTTILLNLGGAYNTRTGKFTAPTAGVYLFTCTSIADGSGATPCELFRNDTFVFTTSRDEDATGPYPIGTNQVLLKLTPNDVIEFRVKPKKGGFLGSILSKFKSPSDISINGHIVHEL